jgi:hypothetical protein
MHTLQYQYCLALYCHYYFENIGFIYPAVSIIGNSLLYTKSVQSDV